MLAVATSPWLARPPRLMDWCIYTPLAFYTYEKERDLVLNTLLKHSSKVGLETLELNSARWLKENAIYLIFV